ncbi:putative DNA helicase [Medicago truncatula]|uniref:Putative DNA helicase n=1 Tax=Medicago truncatula TaxID=3880 RepID=A0A396KA11_MEDTR|nr:putative DNA helicase [Medicago truncatula]
MDPDVNTLRLCVGDRCLIIQLYRADSIPQSLRKLFLDWVYKFGGFSNDWHRERITRSKHGLKMYKDPMELRLLKDGLENLSVEEMVHELLGFEVELKEEIRKSDWSQKDLSDDQVLYAYVEAYAAFAIGVKLRMWDLCF